MKIIEAKTLPKYPYPAVVIGNGPSRLKYDIELLKGRAIVFGCNRFFKDYDFVGYPYFLGACDDEIYRELINLDQKIPLIAANIETQWPNRKHEVLIEYDISFIKYWEDEKWIMTGQAMINTAILLGCNPIFIIGFGDIGNVYYSIVRAVKSTEFEKAQHCVDCIKSYEKKIIRIENHSSLMYKIPYVDWNDLLEHLPKGLENKGKIINDLYWSPI